MSNVQANQQSDKLGFWRRLAIGLGDMGETYDEMIEKRICRLEMEVQRLSALSKNNEKSGKAVND